ncbi:MAG: GNAT family N-acetyltransferase [Chloroflexia bacterium]|nr:GNAT family N-acetyltransferase [Chloroflexia bacterium]
MMFDKTDFEIRDYKEDDYKELIELWALTDLGSPARGDDDVVINRTLKLGGKLLVMTQLSSVRLIGCSWMSSDGRRVYIHHFGIHPDFQGRGLSKPLMQASMDFINELGQQVKLEVHKNNVKAINLYEKFGFKYLGDYLVYIIRDIPIKNTL